MSNEPFADYGEQDEDGDIITDDYLTANKDAVVFVIDCSASMQQKDEDGDSAVKAALRSALSLLKRKVISSSSDLVGIMLYGTKHRTWTDAQGHFLQQLDQADATRIKELHELVEHGFEDDKLFTPAEETDSKGRKVLVKIAEILWQADHALTDRAKTAGSKRIFLITDNDNPHPHTNDPEESKENEHLAQVAFMRANDLAEKRVTIHPFFINRPGQTFDYDRFYRTFLSNHVDTDEDLDQGRFNASAGFSQLETSVRSREALKRSQFSIPMHIAPGVTIGIKGHLMINQQKMGNYRWLSLQEEEGAKQIDVTTRWVVDAPKVVGQDTNGNIDMPAGGNANGDVHMAEGISGTDKVVRHDELQSSFQYGELKVIFTRKELEILRMYEEPGLTILGFKDISAIKIQWNLTKPWFIYPTEKEYTGSNRTFTALLVKLADKKKAAIARLVRRKNAYPVFVALLPQLEKLDDEGVQEKPPGFNVVMLPYADDRRSNPLKDKATGEFASFVPATENQIDAAKSFVEKLNIKAGYRPGRYPNPALQWHYTVLECIALDQELPAPEEAEDNTLPKYAAIEKRVGPLISTWRALIQNETRYSAPTPTAKPERSRAPRAAAEISDVQMKADVASGKVSKHTVADLQSWLERHDVKMKGKKGDYIEKVTEICETL